MTYLTEAEVFARLRAVIAKFPSVWAFAKASEFDSSNAYTVLNGKYKGNGLPPSVLRAIGVRKETVYALVEETAERRKIQQEAIFSHKSKPL